MDVLNTNLSPFFAWLLKTTLQGSLLIGLILLIKLVLRNRLAPRWQYLVWLVLLVRLSLPWAPPSRLSIYNLLQPSRWSGSVRTGTSNADAQPARAAAAEGTAGEVDPVEPSDAQVASDAGVELSTGAPVPVATRRSAPKLGRTPPRLLVARTILPALWLAGAVALGGYILTRNLRLWRMVKRERPVTDQEILELLEDSKMQMGVQTIVGLVVTDRIKSPALFGFIRPRILLPEGLLEALSLDELQYVFLHELAHLKRRDIYLGWLVSLLQVLHWFNPLIWLAFRRMRADQEMACDALALSRMTADEPPAYGRTIVNLLERFSQPQYVPSIAGILEEPSNIERRMTMIAKFKKNSYQWSPLAVVLIVILACISLSDAQRMKASETSATRPAPEPTLRRIEVRTPGRVHSRPSPDGRYLSGVDDTGNLTVHELATGKQWRLTKKEPESKDFAHRSLISPDSTRVAYYWLNAVTEDFDLRVVGLDGSNDRLLWAAEEGAWSFNMKAWSRDGKHIFGEFLGEDEAVRLIRVSADDGSREVVKEFDRARFFTADVSPDGRHVAYDVADSEASNRDILVLDLEANRETPLVTHPANDKLLGWTPDGRHIFFASDRNGTWDGWLLRVDDGTPRGLPEMIKAGLGDVSPVGFTRSGSFYYQFRHQGWNVYVARLDPDTREMLSEPDPVRLVGKDVWPDWSPDGRYLAYCSEPDRSKAQIIRIRTLATGQERELKPDLARFDYLRWCPDGRHLLITNFGRESPSVVYRLDAATGEYTVLVQSDEPRIRQAELSADGKTLAYRIRGLGTMNRLIVRDLESGDEKELLQTPAEGALALAPGSGWALSPDGKHVALSIREDAGKPFVLKIMSVESGECRTLDAEWIFQMAWARDGRDLLVTKNVRELWRVSVKGDESQKLLEWNGMIMGPRIHPDGQRLAFFSGARMSELWVMENFLPAAFGPVAKPARQPDLRRIHIATQPGSGVLSPDGGKLAFVSEGSVWVVPVHGKVSPDIAGEPVRLTEPMGAWDVASTLAWSADGKWIAFNVSGEREYDAIYIISSSGGTPRKVPVQPRRRSVQSYRLSLSPDGKVVAFCSRYIEESEAEPPKEPCELRPSVRGSFIYTVPVAGGKVKRLTDTWSGEQTFSPDGKKIAFVKYDTLKRGELYVIPSAGGNPIQVSDSDPQRIVRGPVWSPDGKMIAFISQTASERNEVCVIRASDTDEVWASPTKIQLPLDSYDVLAGWTRDNKIGVFLHNPDVWAIHTVPVSGGQAVQVTPSGWATHPQWSPDGQRIYFRWNGGAIASVPSDGGRSSIVRVQGDPPAGLCYPGSGNAVSPDGKLIVFSDGIRICTVPVEGGESKEVTQGRYPCWSPDGKSIAFIRTYQRPVKTQSGWNIYTVPSKGGDVRQLTFEPENIRRTHIDWSPDGRSIAYFAKDETIRIIPAQGGESRIVATTEGLKNHDELAWSPDGGKLVYSSQGRIWVVSPDGGEPKEIRTGLDADAGHVSWSPDGEKLAFVAVMGGAEDLYLMEDFLADVVASARQ